MSIMDLERMPVLKAYLGANGVLTGELRSENELRNTIWALFGVNVNPPLTLQEIQESVTALGKQKRRILVRTNLMNLPARLVSIKTAHAKKRAGVLSKNDRAAAKLLHSPAKRDHGNLNDEFRAIMRDDER